MVVSLDRGRGSIAELIAFRDKYLYVMTTIPLDDQPRETTLFNHLIDELDKCPALNPNIDPKNTIVLVMGTPKKVPLILGNPHMVSFLPC